MTGRMNWRKAHLHGRATLDFRREYDTPDRADRWLRVVERRLAQRRQRERRSVNSVSSEVSW
jgi:hypothetical protein